MFYFISYTCTIISLISIIFLFLINYLNLFYINEQELNIPIIESKNLNKFKLPEVEEKNIKKDGNKLFSVSTIFIKKKQAIELCGLLKKNKISCIIKIQEG